MDVRFSWLGNFSGHLPDVIAAKDEVLTSRLQKHKLRTDAFALHAERDAIINRHTGSPLRSIIRKHIFQRAKLTFRRDLLCSFRGNLRGQQLENQRFPFERRFFDKRWRYDHE